MLLAYNANRKTKYFWLKSDFMTSRYESTSGAYPDSSEVGFK